jgi:hypothetical protein
MHIPFKPSCNFKKELGEVIKEHILELRPSLTLFRQSQKTNEAP